MCAAATCLSRIFRGFNMMETFKPRNADHVRELVNWAAASKTPLRLIGRGTKTALGRPVKAVHRLDMSALSGILLYEPEELVFSALAGTPLREIEEALAEHNQVLAFEPADLGPLFGAAPGEGSIGGVFSCNLSGPRRIGAGAARDHLLGFEAVNGLGEAFKSGGRVMKNVTGYDLSKLVCGAYGTLAALTSLTFKVLPAPPTSATLVLEAQEAGPAVEAMTGAFGGPFEISAAAHLPRQMAARSSVADIARAGVAVTLFRLEGVGPSVDYRAERLRAHLGALGRVRRIGHEDSRALWRQIRDVQLLDQADGRCLWRLAVPPASGGEVLARIGAELDVDAFLDHSGGLIWLSAMRADKDAAAHIRAALEPDGGHATLIKAPESLRRAVPVFHPHPPALRALSRRVKASFDPLGILNPGLMDEEA